MTVVQGMDDGVEEALELVEVHDHADRIELWLCDGDADPPVMAVERFERSVVQPQSVGGGKLAGGGDFESHVRNRDC